jgi:hypothetical protein
MVLIAPRRVASVLAFVTSRPASLIAAGAYIKASSRISRVALFSVPGLRPPVRGWPFGRPAGISRKIHFRFARPFASDAFGDPSGYAEATREAAVVMEFGGRRRISM